MNVSWRCAPRRWLKHRARGDDAATASAPIITCPRCFSADDVQRPRKVPDGVLQYCCANPKHGDHEWLTTLDVEYGIVEHRLRTQFPDLFATHVAAQGHSMFGSRPYTASSVRFGVALGRLERRGELTSFYGPATGAWSYNGQVTYWAKGPQPDQRRKTWAEYCAEVGRSPQWTDEDRAGLG